jgi:hypothetical protein
MSSERLDEILIKLRCFWRRGRLHKIGTASFRAITVQRELGNHQGSRANFFRGEIQLSVRIWKNAQFGALGGKKVRASGCVVLVNAKQKEDAAPDLSADFSLRGDGCSAHPLQNHAHLAAPFSRFFTGSLPLGDGLFQEKLDLAVHTPEFVL